MSETPLIDQLEELGPAGLDLLNACRLVADQADRELNTLRRKARGRGRPPADRIEDARRLLDLLEREPTVSATRAAEILSVRRQFAHTLLRAVRPTLIPDTPGWRAFVLARVTDVCEICGRSDRPLHAHHIDGDRENSAYSNGACLCDMCHGSVHAEQDHRSDAILLARTVDDVLAIGPALAYLTRPFPNSHRAPFPNSESEAA